MYLCETGGFLSRPFTVKYFLLADYLNNVTKETDFCQKITCISVFTEFKSKHFLVSYVVLIRLKKLKKVVHVVLDDKPLKFSKPNVTLSKWVEQYEKKLI